MGKRSTHSGEKDERAIGVAMTLIQAIEHRGLDAVGIYRVAGSHAVQQKLKDDLLQSEGVKRLSIIAANLNVHELASTLKQLLRELDPSLLAPTDATYNAFKAAVQVPEPEQNASIAKVLKEQVPKPRLKLACALIVHFRKVSLLKEKNKMSEENIALMVGPAFIRSSKGPTADLLDTTPRTNLILQLLRASDESEIGQVIISTLGVTSTTQSVHNAKNDSAKDTPKSPTTTASPSKSPPSNFRRQMSYPKVKTSPVKKVTMDTMNSTMLLSTDDAFKLFADETTGQLSVEGFCVVIRAQGHVASDRELQHLFNALDMDGDGFIDKNEFNMASTNALLKGPDDDGDKRSSSMGDKGVAQAMELFRQFDVGNKGYLTKAELEYICRSFGDGEELNHSEVADLMGVLNLAENGSAATFEYKDFVTAMVPALTGGEKQFALP